MESGSRRAEGCPRPGWDGCGGGPRGGGLRPRNGLVKLAYQVAYFTNHALPVAEARGSLGCGDALFGGDCRNARGNPFIGWNGIAANGSRAATGAYVARLRFTIRVAGKDVATGGLDQVWGVLR